MPREYGRNRRVADQVQRELAVFIQRDLGDAGLGLITVSTVDVSPDLKNARVYITVLGTNVDNAEIIDILNERAGHFRHELAKSLTMRSVPRLAFVFDSSVERGNRLSALIDSLHKDNE